jgi:hypothetical protein
MTSNRHNADGINTRWLVTNCVCLAFLLLASAVACHSQDTGQLYTFFKQNIGLSDSEIAGIERGKAVAKVLDSPTPSQVFVFGAVFIKAQPTAYVRLSGDLDRLKSLPNYLALQRFSDPPQLSDLRGFGIEADDVDELKKCKPGNCEVQLPIENIQEFRDKIDWSSNDPVDIVTCALIQLSQLCIGSAFFSFDFDPPLFAIQFCESQCKNARRPCFTLFLESPVLACSFNAESFADCCHASDRNIWAHPQLGIIGLGDHFTEAKATSWISIKKNFFLSTAVRAAKLHLILLIVPL